MPMREALELLKPLLEDPSILKIGQNLKFDFNVLARHGMRIHPLDDTMLMSYALDGGKGSHGMDELAMRHLGHACVSFEHVMAHVPGKKSERTFAQVPVDKATEYAAEDADVTLRLWMMLKPRLAVERMATVYETLERPLVPVIADMERAGIKVDGAILSRLSSTFAQGMARLEEEVYGLAGHKFNLASPAPARRVAVRPAEAAGRQARPRRASGRRAPACSTISRPTRSCPRTRRKLINIMLEWRQLTKLRSTYTDALPRLHGSPTRAASTRATRWPRRRRAGSPRPSRTCRTSPSAPRKAARSAPPSSPRRA